MAICSLSSSCATIPQLIEFLPDLQTFGGPSKGVIELTGLTLEDDTLTIGGVTLTAVAGVAAANQWSVDGTLFDQLNSLLAAITGTGASLVGSITAQILTPGIAKIQVSSIITGYYSQIPWSTTSAQIALDPSDKLAGGQCDLEFFSNTACSMMGDCWGSKKMSGHMYLVAHLIEMANGNDNGALTSRSIDKISEGYSYVNPTDPNLANTKWGRLYAALWATVFVGPIVGRALPTTWGCYGRSWR